MWGRGQFETLDQTGLESQGLGTRFRIFPQVPHIAGYGTPETVWISTPPDRLLTGPEDHRLYVRDPLLDKEPYEYPYLPPFVGEIFPPAQAAFDGHFDQIPLNSRQFLAAHAFASVSRVLDIWESYLGRPIVWHFADTYERLEIIPWVEWDNAQSGYGYLELGQDRGPDGRTYPYALNFDVIAHEIGHAILFSLFGTPIDGLGRGDYAPFHEASADLISLLSFLHFDSGLDRLLRNCSGNLLVLNELNRIAELTGDRQIRLASNARRLSEVTDEIHDRSRPFTGALFDTIVDLYHAGLVRDGLADERLLEIDIENVDEAAMHRISDFTARGFRARPFLFKSALAQARDDVALALAQAWPRLDADSLTFENAAEALINASDQLNPMLGAKFEENFRWREIL
ncbi:hypothetical protein [Mesorhizobium camelthorni]|uniref:Peptidase M4 C-terminal domain-containing protein n=1 Tax=Allomesorhizobium camelthorni TaxID=475069 RepID=A0A6G4WC56_9HYPH|nr:hypothetical protein [Mesorhizobium camelthorni]NGO52164.1 hypothetical protein [Mesorhizobium camelthorni]